MRDYADFQDNHIFYVKYFAGQRRAEAGTYFYKKREQPAARVNTNTRIELAECVRDTARKTDTPPAKLTFSIDESERVSSDVKKLKGHYWHYARAQCHIPH